MSERPVAIVTGAGSGIGRVTAIRLAAEGYRLFLLGRDPEKLRRTVAELGTRNSERGTEQGTADLTDPLQCQAAVDAAVERFGRIDALCNIAGYAGLAPIAETTDELWRTTLDTNMGGPFYMTRAAWAVFERQGSGVVVNVSSMASLDPFPGFAAYAAAKAGLNMLTRITASEGAAIGVRAVTIAPGAVETPMLRGLFDERAIPRSRVLDPARVAEVIADCVTGRRAFEPGEVIPITP